MLSPPTRSVTKKEQQCAHLLTSVQAGSRRPRPQMSSWSFCAALQPVSCRSSSAGSRGTGLATARPRFHMEPSGHRQGRGPNVGPHMPARATTSSPSCCGSAKPWACPARRSAGSSGRPVSAVPTTPPPPLRAHALGSLSRWTAASNPGLRIAGPALSFTLRSTRRHARCSAASFGSRKCPGHLPPAPPAHPPLWHPRHPPTPVAIGSFTAIPVRRVRWTNSAWAP